MTPILTRPSFNEIYRWNFESDDTNIMVCTNDHDKSDGCEYQVMHPSDAIAIIEQLTSTIIKAQLALEKVVPCNQNDMIDWAVKSKDSVYTNAGTAYRILKGDVL